MESRAKVLGHALHPMLIVFPLDLLATAVIFGILYLITDGSGFATAAVHDRRRPHRRRLAVGVDDTAGLDAPSSLSRGGQRRMPPAGGRSHG
jgi:hypothetical protein